MESPYDAFAWFYDRYWAAPFQEWQSPALEKLLFADLPPGARVLDVCCGTGQLARRLSRHGYVVNGLDSSAEMLRVARASVPEAGFVHEDAVRFAVDEPFDAVVCTFDSLNHLLEPENVARALRSVHEALKPGGRFVFDVNTGKAYGEHWEASACRVEADHAFFLRGGFDAATRIGTTLITMFRLHGGWQRSDVEVLQRPWEIPEIEELLAGAGFSEIRSYRAMEDLGMNGHYGQGRVYFAACRNWSGPDAL